MTFLAELKRRNVIRMAGLYLVGAWLITQVASTVFPAFNLPDWALRGVILLLAIGFIPALIISWVFELTPNGLRREDEIASADSSDSTASNTAQRMNRMIIVVMALALGYFAFDKFVLVPSRDSAGAPAAKVSDQLNSASPVTASQPEPAKSIDTKSIAVLAFANMSADKDNEYFSDGVAEEILNALAKIDDLKVAGRTSSFYFKGRNEPLTTIGSTLGVAHVLEGSVRKQGKRLRISAKLLRVSDGVEMWADTFDGTDADIFALQEQIAQQVTSQLKVALNAGQQARLVDVGTANPEAYALYLKATGVFNRRAVESIESAIAGAKLALQLDAKFARAYSRLATLYFVSATTADPERYDGLIELARHNAAQALRLNAGLAEPHALLGSLNGNDRRYRDARAAHNEALKIDPNDPTANLWNANWQCNTGYIANCEKGLDRTLDVDPLLPNALGWRFRLLVSSGNLPEAERMYLRAKEAGLRWPGITMRWISLKRGDLTAARMHATDINTVFATGLEPDAVPAFAGAFVGDGEAIKQSAGIIDRYLASKPKRINALVPLTLLSMGQTERGLAVFADHPTSNEALFLGEVMGTRLYPKVWASPAFPEFLRKAGIAAYWNEFGPPEQCRKNNAGDYVCS